MLSRNRQTEASEVQPASSWAPLRIGSYRSLWTAQMGSNFGTWMQTVGAQWLVVHQPHAATLTAAVQAASLLPVLFVSLPAGVLADVFDRRRLLAVLSAAIGLIAGALAVLTWADLVTPAVLLSLTFLLGCGQAVLSPTWQAVQPELVPRELIPAAAALGSLNVNIARAIGPAIAGALVALIGPAVVFGLNAVSFLGVTAAVLAWRRPHGAASVERIGPALRSGLRYVRHAPAVRRIFLRSAVFVLPGSALWALLPVVASSRLGLGAAGYGVLLGALGLGAIIGALVIGWLRARLPDNMLLVVGTLVFALGTAGSALVRSPVAVAALLVPAGTGWLINLSTLSTVLQLTLPSWVRARGLSAYILVFLGGQGAGALVWGLIAGRGIELALLVSAAVLVVGAFTLLRWPLYAYTGRLDRSVSTFPEPALDPGPEPGDGPVLVEINYTVRPERAEEFVAAMRPVELSRRRTGAYAWGLYRDTGAGDRFVEVFLVPSWAEHLSQHSGRMTGHDAQLLAEARALTEGEPAVRHLLRTS
jgi:MFS family permease